MIARLLVKSLVVLICLLSLCDAAFSQTWGSIEYLDWWAENSPVSVPLITRNNNPIYDASLANPGTQIIFGAGSNRNAFDFGGINGGRISVGTWLNAVNQFGIEASAFALAQAENSFTASSVNGAIPVVNIPFVSIPPGSADVLVRPGVANTATVNDKFQVASVELNSLYNLHSQQFVPLVILAGLRYMNVNEGLVLQDTSYPAGSPPTIIRDHFSTNNNFYGIQLGARSNFAYHSFIMGVTAEVAAGENDQTLSIKGLSSSGTLQEPIGLFAESTNSGHFSHHEFAILSSLQAKIAYQWKPYVRPFITYDFIYLNHIIRPGKEIDPNINVSQNNLLGGSGVLSGPAVPAVKFNSVGMWMQGFGIGVEVDC